ncbi:MAG: hypothetical protein R3295_09140 [Marinobacter sp.]|nr:hypothetical protein [Marinobacter sp.]
MTTQHFRYSPGILRTTHMAVLLSVILLPMLGIFVVLAWLGISETGDLSKLIHSDDGSLSYESILVMSLLALLPFIVVSNRKVRVELDSSTLKIHIPRLTDMGLMGLTTGDHRILLHSIQEIRLRPATAPKALTPALHHSRLEVVTARQTYRLQPYNFLRLQGPDHRMGLRDVFGKPRDNLPGLLKEAPLVQSLSAATGQAITVSEPASSGPLANQYNLMTHKGMVAQLALLAILGLYGVADFVLLTDYLVLGNLPLWPFVSAGLLTAALGIRLGRGAPMAERLGVTALVTLAAVAATYPGLQRYSLLASPQPIAVPYQSTATALFEHPGHPTIDQRSSYIPEYWETVPTGSEYVFYLHRPVMGFSMVDMGPVHEKSRAFYQRN